jgi:hypothetical protein
MKLFLQIINRIKEILLIPRNLVTITRQSNNIIGLENKIEAINQKLNELDIQSILQKLDTHLQNQVNGANIKTNAPVNLELNELVSKIQEGFENYFLQLESLLFIYNSLPNLKFLPATRGWAGSPDFLAKIVELILKDKPLFVLEAGSGVSSVIIGLALKLNNYGESISLEHDITYANITSENMGINELEIKSVVKHSPLIEYNNLKQKWKWYDINELKFSNKIDMLIIDGPPRITQELARYPAIPILHEYFSDRFTILLDDSKRDDESIIIQKWIVFLETNKYKVKIENFLNYEKGMTILQVYRC